MVSYITCIVIYLLSQSEYRICSPFDTFNSSLVPSPSVLPRAGLVNAGFARPYCWEAPCSSILAYSFLLVPPGQKHNTFTRLICIFSNQTMLDIGPPTPVVRICLQTNGQPTIRFPFPPDSEKTRVSSTLSESKSFHMPIMCQVAATAW
jgi:hypothetical protein